MPNSISVARRLATQAIHFVIGVLLIGTLVMTPPAISGEETASIYGGGGVFLDIGGKFGGWAHSVSGGSMQGESYSSPTIISQSGEAVRDLDITFGMDMAPVWWAWINQVLGKNPGRTQDMAVIRTDFEGRQIDRIVLREARIKRIAFPLFDGAGKEPILFTVRMSAASSKQERTTPQIAPPRSKLRFPLNNAFGFELGGLPMQRTHRVVPPLVTIEFGRSRIGTSRTQAPAAPIVNIGNMTVNVPMRDYDFIRDWVDAFILGQATQDNLTQARLSVLSPDFKQVIMTIDFDRVGPVRFQPTAVDSSSNKIMTAELELHIEQVRITF